VRAVEQARGRALVRHHALSRMIADEFVEISRFERWHPGRQPARHLGGALKLITVKYGSSGARLR
jgi:hypothetical protein